MKFYYDTEPGSAAWDWSPVDPEEDAADHNDSGSYPTPDIPANIEFERNPAHGAAANLPISLNKELTDKLKDNPNKLLGCGG